MKFIRLKIFFIVIIVFVAVRGYATELDQLYKVRENHFEKGEILDTIFLKNCMLSNNKHINIIAKGILANYYLENINLKGEQLWVALSADYDSTNKTIWFKDEINRDLEMLVFDDFFRISMVLKKYYFFNNILVALYCKDLLITHSIYNLYTKLKSGNIYSFLDKTSGFKKDFINDFKKEENRLSKRLKEKVLFNLSAIDFKNFDTISSHQFNQELNSYSNEITDSSSIESIFFNLALSTLNNDSLRIENIYSYNTKYIYKKSNSLNPFITQIELDNLPLLKNELDFLYNNICDSYNFYVSNNIKLNKYLYFKLFDKIKFKNLFNNHDIDYSTYVNYTDFNEENLFYDVAFKLDSINRTNIDFIYEPNWNYERCKIIFNIGNPNSYVDFIFLQKYKSNSTSKLIKDTYKYYTSQDSLYKFIYIDKTIDDVNIYHKPGYYIDYLFKNTDREITNDLKFDSSLNRIIDLLQHVKNINYLDTNYLSFDKLIMANKFSDYSSIVDKVLFIKKDYKKYLKIRNLDDEYFNKSNYQYSTLEDFNFNIISDRQRYFAFIKSSTSNELFNFDTTLAKFYLNKINNLKFNEPLIEVFGSTHFRDIIIDIFKRGHVNDSLILNMIFSNDLLNNALYELNTNYNIEVNYSDTLPYISQYKNEYFCIDNSNLKFKKNINSIFNSQIINFFDKFNKSGLKSIDTASKYLIYFISNNFSNNNLQYNILNKDLKLFGIYSNSGKKIIKELITLDSLQSIFNFKETKNGDFYSNKYFYLLNQNTDFLYKVLLEPFGDLIKNDTIIKLVAPNSINSIPIDYIYAKKNSKYINFKEYSSLYKTIIKEENNIYAYNDTTLVFSNMVYNDLYCNINKSKNPYLRSGIANLAYSEVENKSISKHIPSKYYTGIKASKENFLNTLEYGNNHVIHLITHGTYISDENSKLEETDPFIKEDPFNESNRRISITLLRQFGVPDSAELKQATTA